MKQWREARQENKGGQDMTGEHMAHHNKQWPCASRIEVGHLT